MSKREIFILFGIIFIILVTWIASPWIIFKLFGYPGSPGEVGDVFGAVGALFSGLAFCGVIWAILLQRKELQLQREDLKATIEEMKQTREANEQSAEMLEKQAKLTDIQIRADILRTNLDVAKSTFENTENTIYLKKYFGVVQGRLKPATTYFDELNSLFKKLNEL